MSRLFSMLLGEFSASRPKFFDFSKVCTLHLRKDERKSKFSSMHSSSAFHKCFNCPTAAISILLQVRLFVKTQHNSTCWTANDIGKGLGICLMVYFLTFNGDHHQLVFSTVISSPVSTEASGVIKRIEA